MLLYLLFESKILKIQSAHLTPVLIPIVNPGSSNYLNKLDRTTDQ